MKRLTPLLLIAVAGSAHAGFENMMNPLAMMAPSPSYGPFGGGYGGMSNPLLGLTGLGGMGGLGTLGTLAAIGALGGPALQLAPGLVTGGVMNQLTNPYMGGPLAGNPLFQQSSPMPFSLPNFGGQGYSAPGYGQSSYSAPGYGSFTPSIPNMPGLPFAAPQQQNPLQAFMPAPQIGYPTGNAYQQGYYQQQGGYPQPMYYPQQGYAPQAASTQQPGMPNFLPFLMQAQPARPAAQPPSNYFPPMPTPQAQSQAQVSVSNSNTGAGTPNPSPVSPFAPFFPPQPAAQAKPQAPVAAAALTPTQAVMPFPSFMTPPVEAKPQAAPAAETKPALPASTPAMPIDAAALMQMFLKPVEGLKQ